MILAIQPTSGPSIFCSGWNVSTYVIQLMILSLLRAVNGNTYAIPPLTACTRTRARGVRRAARLSVNKRRQRARHAARWHLRFTATAAQRAFPPCWRRNGRQTDGRCYSRVCATGRWATFHRISTFHGWTWCWTGMARHGGGVFQPSSLHLFCLSSLSPNG